MTDPSHFHSQNDVGGRFLPVAANRQCLFIELHRVGQVAFLGQIDAQLLSKSGSATSRSTAFKRVATCLGVTLQSYGQRENRPGDRARLRIAAHVRW